MNENQNKRTFQVSGMTCGHCKAAVESAIRGTPGVTAATVDLKAGKAIVEGVFKNEDVVASIDDAGYEAIATSGV